VAVLNPPLHPFAVIEVEGLTTKGLLNIGYSPKKAFSCFVALVAISMTDSHENTFLFHCERSEAISPIYYEEIVTKPLVYQ
jgi:hypothetical protein